MEGFLRNSSRFSRQCFSSKESSNATEINMADELWIILGPIIFFVGICGNILILVVLSRKLMNGSSTGVYLKFMAVADICVLITGIIPDWLEASGIVTFKEIHPITCKLEKFLFYTSGDTAIWICVVFTIDRFIHVCFPMENLRFCRPWTAKYYAIGALILAVLKNFHVFWTRGLVTITMNNETFSICNCGKPTPEYFYFETFIRPWLVFAIVSALPFCVILVCNIVIVKALVRLRKSQEHNSVVSESDNTVIQMTILCLTASFFFLVTVTPSFILLIGKPYWNSPPNQSYAVAKSVINQIFYVNHSMNFFLYCLTGRRFRLVLKLVILRLVGQHDYVDQQIYNMQSNTYGKRRSTGNGVHRLSNTSNSALLMGKYQVNNNSPVLTGSKIRSDSPVLCNKLSQSTDIQRKLKDIYGDRHVV